MTDRICIQSQGKKKAHLSAEHLTSCTNGGCDGGWTKTAFDYYIKSGVVSGGNYATGEGCQAYQMPSCEHHVNKT